MRHQGNAIVLTLLVTFSVSSARWTVADDGVSRNSSAIADVEAGRVETARASWWGADPDDATQSLQAAMNCRAKRVIVEDIGRPWIVTTIQLPSDKEIVFEPGTVVEAKRGEFRGKGDCLFRATKCRRLTVRGKGATFRMHKSDYHKPPYEPAEWRHTLSIRGCEDVTIDGLTLLESGGDGIYVGVGPGGSTNRNVTIRNVVCDGNNRQGISVITAEDLLIENCVFRNTQGTAPQAGIDFEPNQSEERLVNCTLRYCRSENNAGHAYHIYLGQLNKQSPPISLRFENCTSQGNQRYSAYVGVANRGGERTVRGSIEFVECRFKDDAGAGVYVRGNEADGCRVRFDRCEVVRHDEPGTRLAPITIEAPRRLDLDVGNIEITDCMIRDSLARQPLALVASPMTRLRNLTGSVTVKSPRGERFYKLDAAQLDEWFPTRRRVARIPRFVFDWRKSKVSLTASSAAEKGTPFRLRREAALLVWGEANRPVELVARVEPVGRHTPAAGVMTMNTTGGSTATLKPEVETNQLVYRFTPRNTGPHRLHWQGDSATTLRPVRCSAPVAILGESPGVDLIRPTGTLYFPVPSGVQRFAIQVAGQGTGETVKATVRDAAGRVVDQQDNIGAPHVFFVDREKAAPETIWSITLERAGEGVLEDVSLQTLGVPPVFGATRGDVLVPVLPEKGSFGDSQPVEHP